MTKNIQNKRNIQAGAQVSSIMGLNMDEQVARYLTLYRRLSDSGKMQAKRELISIVAQECAA